MSDPRRPSLFDLPLDPPNASDAPSDGPSDGSESSGEAPSTPAAARPRGPRRAAGDPLPLFPDEESHDTPDDGIPPRPEPPRRPDERSARSSSRAAEPPAEPASTPSRQKASTGPRPAPLGARFQAGLLDLLIHLGLALAALAVGLMVGVPWRPRELGGLALFLLIFSFLYTVIPLAFWGRTPGMVRVGLVARSRETGALTFGQTAQRWLGAVFTVLLVGLPVLLALVGGRSLADRLSDSRLWLDPP